MEIKYTLPVKAYRVKIDFNQIKSRVDIYVYVIKWGEDLIKGHMSENPPTVKKKIRITVDEMSMINDDNYINDLIEKTANELYDNLRV